jgi:tripartite-type tricarboxylate transporter receptor subunit TctC
LKRGLVCLVAALMLWSAAGVQAQTVRMLVGYPPGGGLDTLGRVFSEKLSDALGRPVIVENRPGALGQLAIAELRKAAPDGNTLMVTNDSAITLWPHTVKAPGYDTLRDVIPIAHVGSYDSALAVGPGSLAKDFREWAALAKADPKNAIYGSPGAGSNQHFLGFMLGQAIGVPLTHVPYKGVQPALSDLLGGQVPAIILPYAQMLPHIKAGKIRALAQSGTQRIAAQPEVPTLKELGYPSLEISGWYLIIAPAGLSEELVKRYHAVCAQAMKTQAIRDRMHTLDLDIREMTPAEISARLKQEYERWRPVVAASGFQSDN